MWWQWVWVGCGPRDGWGGGGVCLWVHRTDCLQRDPQGGGGWVLVYSHTALLQTLNALLIHQCGGWGWGGGWGVGGSFTALPYLCMVCAPEPHAASLRACARGFGPLCLGFWADLSVGFGPPGTPQNPVSRVCALGFTRMTAWGPRGTLWCVVRVQGHTTHTIHACVGCEVCAGWLVWCCIMQWRLCWGFLGSILLVQCWSCAVSRARHMGQRQGK
jgi:hypothetical protein